MPFDTAFWSTKAVKKSRTRKKSALVKRSLDKKEVGNWHESAAVLLLSICWYYIYIYCIIILDTPSAQFGSLLVAVK